MGYKIGDEITLTVTKLSALPKETLLRSILIVLPEVLWKGLLLIAVYSVATYFEWI